MGDIVERIGRAIKSLFGRQEATESPWMRHVEMELKDSPKWVPCTPDKRLSDCWEYGCNGYSPCHARGIKGKTDD